MSTTMWSPFRCDDPHYVGIYAPPFITVLSGTMPKRGGEDSGHPIFRTCGSSGLHVVPSVPTPPDTTMHSAAGLSGEACARRPTREPNCLQHLSQSEREPSLQTQFQETMVSGPRWCQSSRRPPTTESTSAILRWPISVAMPRCNPIGSAEVLQLSGSKRTGTPQPLAGSLWLTSATKWCQSW